jgi:two-component system, OmpR family, phosphate regulon sensor histidine kinase PhoR
LKSLRIAAAILVAAAAILLAWWTEPGLIGLLMAALGGAAGMTIALRRASAGASPGGKDWEGADLPTITDLLNATGAPLMVVRDRSVLLANDTAVELLGSHIVGSDIRLALRHPSATEALAELERGLAEEVEAELVGLGQADSHWVMKANRAGADLLVRLIDRSSERALEQMRADFVANASHELRTPLATLLGFLETLEDDAAAADKATRTRFLEIMTREASRMRNLVDDLMSLSRVEADRFTAPRAPVDLIPLIESVRDGCRALAESRGSEIVVENVASGTVVPGDSAQLAQLLSNLVTNALKYGEPGTPVRITVEDVGASLVRVRVIDEGEGIAREHIPRLTERFYRIDPGRSRSGGGTGLGLAIAKHIALRHRGRLEIVSKLGEGTSVRVYLPRTQTEPVTQLSSS